MASHSVTDADRAQMQALIGVGFNTMAQCEYVLLDVEDGAKARAWLAQVADRVWTIGMLGQDKRGGDAWSVAFTHRGLARLGIAEDPQAPFPTEFREGQADETRRKLLCEDPALEWRWGDVAQRPNTEAVSLLVVRAHDGSVPCHPLLETAGLPSHGLRLVRRVHADPDSIRRGLRGTQTITYVVEPFGFRDGMGQPKVQGLQSFRTGGPELEAQADVPLGEFVLGHANAYGETSHCPEVLRPPGAAAPASFARNGCYLAVQQILQHVEAFRAFEALHPPVGDAPSLAEKMMGRRKDGKPLQATPCALEPDDDFGFRANDPHGLQCPVGAHIRRANPRDSLETEATVGDRPKAGRLHRLLRRSRPFASTGARDDGAPARSPAPEVGMFFIAVVADLSRQFEFVKRSWIGNPRFGNLGGEVDPFLSRGQGRGFTTPGQPIGGRVHALPDLTETQGGGYFFMPSLATLRAIAAGHYTTGA